MDEFLVLLQAKLDEAKSKGNVNADIKELQNQLDKLKVQVELDPKVIQNLANSIEKLVNQKIVISNIGIDTKTAVKTGQDYGKQFSHGVSQGLNSNSLKLDTFKKSLENIGMGSKEIDSVASKINNLGVQIETLNQTRSSGKKDILSVNIAGTDQYGQAIKLTQQYNIATGELVNTIDAVSTAQQGIGNNTNSIKKAENVFADYTAKIEQFKSTNSNILSGLLDPLSDFESKLSGLKNGTASIDDVINSYKNLNAEASKITSNLSAQFNKVDSAVRNITKGDEVIASLRADFKGLTNAPKEVNSELTKCEKLLLNVKNIEIQEGRTVNWSAAYKEWEKSLDSLKAKIATLKKEQSNVASSQIFNTKDLDSQGKIYIQKVNNTIEKTKAELESKLRNAGYMDIQIKGTEDASGKIKSLTATVTDATGAFKQLNFERAKIQNNGKAQAGFVQTDDVRVIGNISSSIGKVQNNLSSLKTEWEEQGVLVGEFKTKVEQLDSSLSSIGSKGELNGIKTQIQELKNEASTILKVNEIQLSMDTGETESKIGALISRTNQWTDTNGNARISTQSLTDALDKLGIASNEYLKIPTEEKQKSLIEANEQLSIEYKKVASEVRSMNAEFAKDSTIDSLRQQYQTFYSENGKAHKQFGSQLKSAMSELAHGAEVPKQRVAELKRELLDTKNVCKELGLTGQTWFQNLGDKIKQLSTYLSGTVIIGKLLQSGKQIVDNVSKVDVSLVELEKVSDLTADGLEKVTDRAFELGKSLAKTGTDVLDAVTTFKRAGYDIEESMSYAEQALKTTNISENIQDAGQAADSLVNIMKGFQNESPEFARKINDAVNQVSNTEAVDFDNLIDGATRLSAVADQAGMSFEQMLGTLTGGYEILGNMEKVATGQITIFSRLQAIQLDGEEEVSTVAKLQETFNNATKGAVNIVDQTTGQLRNVYDILDDVANVWDELDKNTREALAIEAAGIRQKNVFLAMMQNWEGVKDAVESASDSVGSADVENEKYIKSIQGRVENFERSVQQLSRTVLDSDIIKWFVDLGTTGVNAIDKIVNTFGSLGTIGLGAGLFTSIKNVGMAELY